MTWAHRLKRVFNTDIEICGRRGGSVRVIADASDRCIEDQDVIDRILAHLRDKEQGTPNLPHLAPPSRAPPQKLPVPGESLILDDLQPVKPPYQKPPKRPSHSTTRRQVIHRKTVQRIKWRRVVRSDEYVRSFLFPLYPHTFLQQGNRVSRKF